MRDERIAVIGLGYVGLPVALAFSRQAPDVVGFDVDLQRVETLRAGVDWTAEVDGATLRTAHLRLTNDPGELEKATVFILTVPTPIDKERRPDLGPLLRACETIGHVIRAGALVVIESTVYPGVTEEVCGPAIAKSSRLEQGRDFKLGYSPERINPADREHTLERVIKVVAGEDADTLDRVAQLYETIVPAGIFRAPSIKVAEAAKVIENTQRDLNIALMNELAIICHRLGIRTHDVLETARTKWNFLPFAPGLVGGHCIGVDPYYLTAKAEALGYYPQVILAGRRINDGMGEYIAQHLVKLLIRRGHSVKGARVGILGLTFKENVPDIRNSRVPDIVHALSQFEVESLVHDPLADAETTRSVYGLELMDLAQFHDLDALVLAVAHDIYRLNPNVLLASLTAGGILIDVKSVINPEMVSEDITYWSL